MVREGISPAPTSTIFAKASDHVNTWMNERAIVDFRVAETLNSRRLYQQTPALQLLQTLFCSLRVIKVNTAVLVN